MWVGLGFGRSLRNVWHQIDLERELSRERERDKELPSALQQLVGKKEEEERKGVAANSIISCCSVKPFVYSPLTPWLLYLRNTIKDCEGVARTVELFDTLSLFNWNTNPVGLCFFERKRVQRYESVNSCKRRPSDFGDQV